MSKSLVGEGKKAAFKEREGPSAKDGRGERVCGNGDILLSGCSPHQGQLELKR